ncbi:multidrug MFS transporter [Levilactobacillus spicheri]|uniref:Multidrug MFS transporter n=1 Tax=Levilactobacillus spicheri TaxID=216463 RepID=A0A0F3RPB1_9LACO|nr:multidrug MFS transporter [Levilactobacillus spicheri]
MRYSFFYLFIKRLADIIISAVALFFLSPVFVLVLLLDVFSRENRGPLFYKQVRVGLHGVKFKMFKFRSMIVDADKKLYSNPELYKKYVNNNFKLEPQDDPRITKIGKLIRRTSIDEIPQFINIIKGDMSLIGPRPVIEKELVEYDEKKLLSVKPGAMGLWQASGRSNVGYPKRAEIEMHYIDEAGLWVDCKIMVKNIKNIFNRNGAY